MLEQWVYSGCTCTLVHVQPVSCLSGPSTAGPHPAALVERQPMPSLIHPTGSKRASRSNVQHQLNSSLDGTLHSSKPHTNIRHQTPDPDTRPNTTTHTHTHIFPRAGSTDGTPSRLSRLLPSIQACCLFLSYTCRCSISSISSISSLPRGILHLAPDIIQTADCRLEPAQSL